MPPHNLKPVSRDGHSPVYNEGMSEKETITDIERLLEKMTNKTKDNPPVNNAKSKGGASSSEYDEPAGWDNLTNTVDAIYKRDHGRGFGGKNRSALAEILLGDLWTGINAIMEDSSVAESTSEGKSSSNFEGRVLHPPLFRPIYPAPPAPAAANSGPGVDGHGGPGLETSNSSAHTASLFVPSSTTIVVQQQDTNGQDDETVDSSPSDVDTVSTDMLVDEGLYPNVFGTTDSNAAFAKQEGTFDAWSVGQRRGIDVVPIQYSTQDRDITLEDNALTYEDGYNSGNDQHPEYKDRMVINNEMNPKKRIETNSKPQSTLILRGISQQGKGMGMARPLPPIPEHTLQEPIEISGNGKRRRLPSTPQPTLQDSAIMSGKGKAKTQAWVSEQVGPPEPAVEAEPSSPNEDLLFCMVKIKEIHANADTHKAELLELKERTGTIIEEQINEETDDDFVNKLARTMRERDTEANMAGHAHNPNVNDAEEQPKDEQPKVEVNTPAPVKSMSKKARAKAMREAKKEAMKISGAGN